jgi:endonuclease-3 related protein
MSFSPSREELLTVFNLLLERYGRQNWWPADSAFEVMVGSILTQNTAWINVERAIRNLKDAGVLSFRDLPRVPRERLAALIRPAGYFNVKAERLLSFCRFLVEKGGESALREMKTDALRRTLLSVKGVGPETADDMMLFAFERPVFVIDAYTRRIFFRLGLARGDEDYEELRSGFESALGPNVRRYNEYHALLVRHAKEACGRNPHCARCCLEESCAKRDQTGE